MLNQPPSFSELPAFDLRPSCATCPRDADTRIGGLDLCVCCAQAARERARAADDAYVLRWIRRGGSAQYAPLPGARRDSAITRLLASGQLIEQTITGIDAVGRPTRRRSIASACGTTAPAAP